MCAIFYTPKNYPQSLAVLSGLRSVPGVTFGACLIYLMVPVFSLVREGADVFREGERRPQHGVLQPRDLVGDGAGRQLPTHQLPYHITVVQLSLQRETQGSVLPTAISVCKVFHSCRRQQSFGGPS